MRAATILLGSSSGDHSQRKHSAQLFHRLAHGIFERESAAVAGAHRIFFHQMSNDFSVGLGGELVSFFHQLPFQAEIILDDAVVHDHDFAGAVAVRMGIFFGGTTVRGPAGVPDAVGSVDRLLADGLFQVAQFAFGAAELQPSPLPATAMPAES